MDLLLPSNMIFLIIAVNFILVLISLFIVLKSKSSIIIKLLATAFSIMMPLLGSVIVLLIFTNKQADN